MYWRQTIKLIHQKKKKNLISGQTRRTTHYSVQTIRLYLANLRINYKTCSDVFNDYCNEWKLTINVSKTKVLIISGGRPSIKIHFYLDRTKLEIVHGYKYLGIYLSRSGSFSTAKKYIVEQANKALFSLLRKIHS